MGFNSAFKGLMYLQSHIYKNNPIKFLCYNYLNSRSVFVSTLYTENILRQVGLIYKAV